MPHTKKIIAGSVVLVILGSTAAWLFRVPQTQGVLLAPVNSTHR
jgi:hypothetical protein